MRGLADIAAAEIQLLRQALDKLQSETQNIDDELAKAREQAIFSELERAELRHELETVTAQLQACEATKAELESTISKVGMANALHGRALETMCMDTTGIGTTLYDPCPYVEPETGLSQMFDGSLCLRGIIGITHWRMVDAKHDLHVCSNWCSQFYCLL